MKKLTICILAMLMLSVNASAGEFSWASEAVDYCVSNGILHGNEYGDLMLGDYITNEQTATILMSTFRSGEISNAGMVGQRWSAPYVNAYQNYTKKPLTSFDLTSYTTREEFVSSLVLASGLTENNIRNRDILRTNFNDYSMVSTTYTNLICIAVERGYMKGSDGYLNPKKNITRAEACSLIYRTINANKNGQSMDLGVVQSYTPLIGEAQISVEQAKQWARNRGAADRFVNIADSYWYYGQLMGVRPEILYAQAAKETNFGKYTGNVIPEQNNWAGIKVAGATGDTTYDHESFATPEDGVRGHYNHMGAYIGLKPIGEPHGRYYATSKISWAGTVKTLEELGGKWCPDLYYGYSILYNYIEPMMNTKY